MSMGVDGVKYTNNPITSHSPVWPNAFVQYLAIYNDENFPISYKFTRNFGS